MSSLPIHNKRHTAKVVKVVDITGNNVASSYKLELNRVPQAQALPRLGKHGVLQSQEQGNEGFQGKG